MSFTESNGQQEKESNDQNNSLLRGNTSSRDQKPKSIGKKNTSRQNSLDVKFIVENESKKRSSS